MNREKNLIIAVAGYLTLVCCVIVVFPLRPPGGQHFTVGLAFGSLFGFTILPPNWIAFGPGNRMVRWPLACLMLIAVPLSLSFEAGREIGPIVLSQIAITVCLFLFAALLRFQLRIRLMKPTEPETMPLRVVVTQYGIRHLMILTAVIAVLLSVGRVIVPLLSRFRMNDLPVWAFLAFSSCVICVPILLSLLTLRNSFWPTISILGLSILATWNEVSLLASLKLRGPDFFHFVWINFFTLLPVLLVAVGLRRCGYRLIGQSKRITSMVESHDG